MRACPSAFQIESSKYGRARVMQQPAVTDEAAVEEVQVAIETCPVDCIHWVRKGGGLGLGEGLGLVVGAQGQGDVTSCFYVLFPGIFSWCLGVQIVQQPAVTDEAAVEEVQVTIETCPVDCIHWVRGIVGAKGRHGIGFLGWGGTWGVY